MMPAGVRKAYWTLSVFAVGFASLARGELYHLVNDWSDTQNPNGVWSYNEDNNPLPHVDAWQRNLGGWSVHQPGWAESEDGSNRLPFWFKSNGSETFGHDWLAGDVVVHTTDAVNGAGNGLATVVWTAPMAGVAEIIGSVWMGRDIGRSNDWSLFLNGQNLTDGKLFSGDPFSRSNPMDYSSGSNGPGAIQNLSVQPGDTIRLVLSRTSDSGDFVGVNLRVNLVPEPATLGLAALGALTLLRRRR